MNDGSADATWSKLRALFDRDENISVVMDLFSTAGQQAAVTAGMVEARRRLVIARQRPATGPGELPLLVAEYDQGYGLVSGLSRISSSNILV